MKISYDDLLYLFEHNKDSVDQIGGYNADEYMEYEGKKFFSNRKRFDE